MQVGRIHWRNAQTISEPQRARLEAQVEHARAVFEEHFGRLEQPLRIDLDQGLRTGYNLETGWLQFPELEGVVERGIESEDVVHHEAFHAMVAQKFPHSLPLDKPEKEILHEALADWFAYQLQPDEAFGEGYREDGTPLRQYRNDLRLPLVSGAHASANAITDLLLEHQVGWSQIRTFLQQPDFSLEQLAVLTPSLRQEQAMHLEERVLNYPPSTRRRYRIEPERPLQLELRPNAALRKAHPRLQVEWTNSGHFEVKPQGPELFSIAPKNRGEASKMLALFKEDGKVLGFRPYYFSTDRKAEAKPAMRSDTDSTESMP